ncbi:MAG: DUF6728 family protein [Bacteroidia bacterium]
MIKKFIQYLTFWRKNDTDTSSSINLRIMHGINRISILMFLFAMIVLIIRYAF